MKKHLLVLIFVFLTVFAYGQKLPFQGKLIESGAAVEGDRDFVFEISSVGWSETHTAVSVTDGLYFVVLGSINPLPGILFAGVEEQSLEISVNGTALSPVILFKPFIPEFDGEKLQVRNTNGGVVGSLHALVDSTDQIGELVVSGTNGNTNVSLTGTGNGKNFGSVEVSDDAGDVRAQLSILETKKSGRLTLTGNEEGQVLGGMLTLTNSGDLPFVNLIKSGRTLAKFNVWKNNTDSIGQGQINLYDGVSKSARFSPEILFMNDGNGSKVDLRVQNWSNLGNSGNLKVSGPTSQNIELSSRHWENPDLPMLNLNGSSGFHAMELSVVPDDNGEEYGFINLMSENGKSLHLSPEGFSVEGVGMNTNSSPNGNSGYLFTRGPNTTNFETGGDWNSPDRAYLNMNGDTDEHRLRFAIYEDGDQNEYGNIEIRSSDNKQAVFEHNNISFVNTDTWAERMSLRSEDNGQGGEMGVMHLITDEQKSIRMEPTSFALRDDANGYHHLLDMGMHDASGNGWSSYFNLRGPNSDNINMGAREWDGTPDMPFLNFRGENDFHAMELTVFKDGNGEQYGSLNLMSENGKSFNLNPNGLNIDKVGIYTDTHGGISAGHIGMAGPNSNNISMGGKSWDDMDLPFIHMFGKNDGAEDFHALDLSVENGTEQRGYINLRETTGKHTWLNSTEVVLHGTAGNQTIALASNDFGHGEVGNLRINGPSSTVFEFMPSWWDQPNRARLQLNGSTNEGRMNIGVAEDGSGNEHGEIYIHSADQVESYIGPKRISLKNNNIGSELISLSSQNNNNSGWAGYVDVMGASTTNIHLGSKDWENVDLPWLALDGTRTNLMHLTAIGGATEFGYMHLISEDGSTSNISAYRIENNNGAGMTGHLGSDRVSFNDNGQEMTYNAWGISGVGPLNIGMDVTVTGTVTESSDKRYKRNIQQLGTNTLGKVTLLEGVSYNWRQDEFPEKNFSSDKQIGVIAQELEAQFPELVKTDKEGYKSVNYSGFAAVLLEAVKELNTKVEKLESENSQLKAELSASAANTTEIDELKEQMQALVKMVQLQQTEESVEGITSTLGLK